MTAENRAPVSLSVGDVSIAEHLYLWHDVPCVILHTLSAPFSYFAAHDGSERHAL